MSMVWLFIGILIGLFAAERKKFNMLGGAVVGALLGPLAVLMFFASGPKMKLCPYCAEQVQLQARVCKHCHKDLPVAMAASAARALFAAVCAGACLLTVACASEPPAPLGTISSEQAQQLVIERDEARDAAAATEGRYRAEIEDLKGEIADLRSQLGMAQETAEQAADRAARYEAGLGKAVAKLNEVSQEATDANRLVAANRAAVASSRQSARARRESSGGDGYFTDPVLSIVEDSVVASGQFYNPSNEQAVGKLYLDLVSNGEVIATAAQPIRANQKSWASWQQEFHAATGSGQVSVVPRFVAD